MLSGQMAMVTGRVAPAVAGLGAGELARARAYLYGDLLWGTLSQLWMFLLLAAAWWSGAMRWLARHLRRAWLQSVAVTAVLFAVILGLLWPFDFYLGWVRERQFGFEHLSAGAWLGQWTLSLLTTTVAGVVVAAIVYAWLRRPGGLRWWLRMWIVVAVGVVLGVAIQPILIAPLFNHFTPLRNPEQRAELEALARRAGIPHAEILEVDASRQSAHTNAYVVGILGSQRIVVYDTLLQQESPPELAFTVGHEIGHYVLDHLWKGVGFTVALLLGMFAMLGWGFPRLAPGASPADAATLPLTLLILLVLLFLLSPATNGFSRWEEHQADAYGLQLSGQACAAAASFEQEEHTDLIYPDPPGWIVWWFFNHPDQQARIDFAARACAGPKPGPSRSGLGSRPTGGGGAQPRQEQAPPVSES